MEPSQWIALAVVAYIIGFLWAGAVFHDNQAPQEATITAAVFWPVVLVAWIISTFVRGTRQLSRAYVTAWKEK